MVFEYMYNQYLLINVIIVAMISVSTHLCMSPIVYVAISFKPQPIYF